MLSKVPSVFITTEALTAPDKSKASAPFQAFPYVLTIHGNVKLLSASEWTRGEKIERTRIIIVITTVAMIVFFLLVS
jgi:hypothetical protein